MKTHEQTGAALCPRPSRLLNAIAAVVLVTVGPVSAQERLCDNSFEDCRTPILDMIRAERVGIDVSFWFMTDPRYSSEIIARWRAGVPVRILLDLRADANYPANATVRQSFINAGIPIRQKTTTGINHWKMMLYAGQHKVHFSPANFANGSYSPLVPYISYVDEAVYFTDDASIVESFMTKFDALWTDTTNFQDLANITGPLTRHYPLYPLDPTLNFPPDQDYQDRLVAQMRQETQQIDVAMFRITSAKVPDEMIRRRQAGVTVRLITDIGQYRNTSYFWDSYNVDRMYVAGIPIKRRRRDSLTDQDMHQKSVVLYGRDMAVLGSSNWTSSSSDTQREHNYFTNKTWFVDWFKEQFERKWNNLTSAKTPLAQTMYFDFVPGWPEMPVNVSPANVAADVAASVLRWEGGWWAHKYDIYFGTTNPPPLIAEDFMPGSGTAGLSSNKETFNPCAPPAPFVSVCPTGLAAGNTYYWMVRGKTMVGNARAVAGPIWSFTTAGAYAPPTPSGLQATAVSSTRIDLRWGDVAGEAGYRIDRKLATSGSWTEVGATVANIVTYQDSSGLAANATYNYRVCSWAGAVESPYSNIVTVSTPSAPPPAGRIAADAYVRGGPYAQSNFGTAGELIAKGSSDPQYQRDAYLILNIGDIQAGNTVTLRLAGRLSDARAASVTTYVYPVTSATWSESSITWNTKPAAESTAQGSIAVSGTATRWYDVDLTGFVQTQRSAGRTAVAVALKTSQNALPYVSFGSRESAIAPQLVTTSAPPPQPSLVASDTYARAGQYTNTNYGTAPELVVKFSSDVQYAREAYLIFDVSSVAAGHSVSLRLNGRLSDARQPTVSAQIFAVADTTWSESSLTWSTRPAAGALLGSLVVNGTSSSSYTVDLTSYVVAERAAGRTRIAIAIKSPTDALPYISFGSRESANHPDLVIQ